METAEFFESLWYIPYIQSLADCLELTKILQNMPVATLCHQIKLVGVVAKGGVGLGLFQLKTYCALRVS